MAINPQFTAVPKIGAAVISTANTNRDGSGPMTTLFVSGEKGSRIESVVVQAISSTSIGMVRLFISDGTNNHLFMEIPVPQTSPSGTDSAFRSEVTFSSLVLPPGYVLKVSTHNSDPFSVVVIGGDF